MDDRDFQERLMPRVLRLDADGPDPNLVAAYVDGTLPEAERRRLEREVAVDPEAMLLVRALRADRRRALVRRVSLLAAALLVAVGGAAALLRGRGAASGSTEDRLVAAASRLREADGATFRDFTPLRGDELATAPSATRGGGRVVWPVGLLLAAPTEIRWRAPEGATRVRVAVDGPGTSWSVVSESDWVPTRPLPPGRYAVRIRALDALGGNEVRGAFEVATTEEAARHARAFERIRVDAPPELAYLLKSHYALRNALYREARLAAEASRVHESNRPIADALLRHLDLVAPAAR